jgi:hypothetical protein
MKSIISLILLLITTTFANAVPLTTKPNIINMMVTPCAANTLILGNGATAAPLCGPVLDTNVATWLTTPTGANLAAALTTALPVSKGGTNCTAASGTCLDNITGFATTGLEARTGAGTYSARTITGTSGQLTVTNGDGVSGNPTLTIGAIPAFSVNKNGTDQTGIASATFTQVTFGTELYDVGNFFASNAWTPPAGKVHMSADISFSGSNIPAASNCAVAIFKNAASFMQVSANPFTNAGAGVVSIDDIANGSDAYTVSVFITTGGGTTATVTGNAVQTRFTGHWISP